MIGNPYPLRWNIQKPETLLSQSLPYKFPIFEVKLSNKMPPRKLIDKNRILHLETTTVADGQILSHIKSAILGTPARLRYKQLRVEEKLRNIKDIRFIVLTRENRILGSVGLLRRDFKLSEENIKSWYIRYFSIKAPFRSNSQQKEKVRDRNRGEAIIRNIVLPYAEVPTRLDNTYDPEEKTLVYGYIETRNFRSMNFSEQMGGETVRKYKTIIASRIRPRGIKGFRKLGEEEGGLMKKRIREYYSEYNFFISDNLFFNRHYFVIEKNGEIIAGLQALPEQWQIVEMGEGTGSLLMKVASRLSVLRKIFNPEKFEFLAIEGIWLREGFEDEINNLVEGACNYYKLNFAMTWLDSDSKLYRKIDHHLDCGIAGRFFGRNEVAVRVTFTNFSEKEKQSFYKSPAYISAYDMV